MPKLIYLYYKFLACVISKTRNQCCCLSMSIFTIIKYDFIFFQNRDKYDAFEIPRNKVIIQEEIGKGAFGTVFKGKLYKLGSTGYTPVAVKLLRGRQYLLIDIEMFTTRYI